MKIAAEEKAEQLKVQASEAYNNAASKLASLWPGGDDQKASAIPVE